MMLSDVSIKRPVLASVFGLLLIAIGIVSATRLSLREYPDIDPPIVSIRTSYPGASANVVETRITEVIEDRVAGVEGIKYINSVSQDGASSISIEFDISRDMDSAANDVRDRVAGILRMLPEEADPPEVQKADASEEIVLWLNLQADNMTPIQLTDYAERYLVDRFSSIDGVARVQLGGQRSPAMRVWIDRQAVAARGLTVADIERAVRTENVENPAGSLTSQDLVITARIERPFRTTQDFANLVIAKGKEDGVLVRLGDVARVEYGAEEDRNIFRGNGQQMMGIGIVKQSTANVVQVAADARARADEVGKTLPEGMRLAINMDTSVFVNASIHEVFLTLGIAVALVIGVIYVFLGSFRATIVPALTVPISLVATFIVLYAMGLSINLLTLLALVLAIGLVVDDAIVVLENIHRRIEEDGETPLVASYRGTRQVGFAVVATTAVLVSVFIPITFMQGQMGRLFAEFAIAMAAAVAFSMLVALTISPMMASKLLKPHHAHKEGDKKTFAHHVDAVFGQMRKGYGWVYDNTVSRPIAITVAFLAVLGGTYLLFISIPAEYTPNEDRGQFQIMISAPEGASFEYTSKYIDEIEARLLPMVGNGEIERIAVRAPGFGPGAGGYSNGSISVLLTDWGHRRDGFIILSEINRKISDIPGVRAFATMNSAFGRGGGQPIQFVIGGPSYETLMEWRNTFVDALNADNPGIANIDWDFKETQQQYRIDVDYNRAADLGVTVQEIGSTLQTMLGSKRVGTFIENGEERYVIFEGDRTQQATPQDMANIYVRSARTQELIPLSNLVKVESMADSRRLNRYNRVRAITINATLQDGVSLGVALDKMEATARRVIPDAKIDYKGQSLDYKRSGSSIGFVFAFGILVVFLVLAAQFESWVHPFVIMLCVPATVGGGLLGLLVTGNTLNIYSQIGLIMLVGLAAKNGILIVEFANQLRDKGMAFNDALREASLTRFRPILMTSLTAIAGAIPLIFSHGAGSETRSVIGVVILFGVTAAMLVTLVLVPAAYSLLARRTGSPNDIERKLAKEEEQSPAPSLAPAE